MRRGDQWTERCHPSAVSFAKSRWGAIAVVARGIPRRPLIPYEPDSEDQIPVASTNQPDIADGKAVDVVLAKPDDVVVVGLYGEPNLGDGFRGALCPLSGHAPSPPGDPAAGRIRRFRPTG